MTFLMQMRRSLSKTLFRSIPLPASVILLLSLSSACSSGSGTSGADSASNGTGGIECTNCTENTWKGYYRIRNQEGWFTNCTDKRSYPVRTGIGLKVLNEAYYRDRSGPDADLLVMVTATAVSAESRGLHPPSTELHVQALLRTLPGSRCEIPAGISSKLTPESTSSTQTR